MERHLQTLDELGSQLKSVDHMIHTLVRERMRLALAVEESKRGSGTFPPSPIIREDVEARRVEQARKWAEELGTNPGFAAALQYQLISESCRVQVGQFQDSSRHRQRQFTDETAYQAHLKANLLRLADSIAPEYEASYRAQFPATRLYLEYELGLIEEIVDSLEGLPCRALDIGCATGPLTRWLASRFDEAIGIDISEEMIRCAQSHQTKNARYMALDADRQPIDLPDQSVMFIAMNMGTGSDVENLSRIWKETERLLAPGGAYLFSFYNPNALVYGWSFIPWPVPLGARMDRNSNSLQVSHSNETFEIPACARTLDELVELVPVGLSLTSSSTYPTIASILPEDAFDDAGALSRIVEADCRLSNLNTGAYIVISGTKPAA